MKNQEIEVHCAYDKLVAVTQLRANLANPNKHPPKQVEKLVKLIESFGWRHPITVSERSGFIVAGHCRLLAAQKLGLKTVPVDYQPFDNDPQEWAVLVSDNVVQEFSEIDGLKMADILVELDQVNFPLELTGLDPVQIEDYVVGPTSTPVSQDEQSRLDEKKKITCPECGCEFTR